MSTMESLHEIMMTETRKRDLEALAAVANRDPLEARRGALVAAEELARWARAQGHVAMAGQIGAILHHLNCTWTAEEWAAWVRGEC